MNKKVVIAVLAVAVLLCCILVVWKYSSDKAEDIAIGLILPLTGDAAQYGKDCQRGAELAAEQLNALHGISDRRLRLIYQDSQGDPRTAVTCINRLLTVDNVYVVVGDMFSATTLAIAPIAQRNNVTLISPTASAQAVPRTGDHVFSIYPSDAYDGEFLGREIRRLWPNFARVAIVYSQAEAMVTCKEAFKTTVKNEGIIIISEDGIPPGTHDLSTLVARIDGSKPEIVFCALYLPETAALLREAARQGTKTQFLGISTCYDSKLFELVGKGTRGLVFSAPIFDLGSKDSEIASFVSAYEHRYGEKPTVWAAYGYDAMRISARGIELSKGDRSKVHSAIAAISGFQGATGTTSFNSDRTVTKGMRLLTADFDSRTFTPVN